MLSRRFVVGLALALLVASGGACDAFSSDDPAPSEAADAATADAGRDAASSDTGGATGDASTGPRRVLVFVSEASVMGTDSSLQNPDRVCRELLAARVDGGDAVAWMASQGTSPYQRLGAEERTWVLPSGAVVFRTRDAILDGGPERGIDERVDGAVETQVSDVLTGIHADGGFGDDCAGWANLAWSATVGAIGAVGAAWTDRPTTASCNGWHKILCFEK